MSNSETNFSCIFQVSFFRLTNEWALEWYSPTRRKYFTAILSQNLHQTSEIFRPHLSDSDLKVKKRPTYITPLTANNPNCQFTKILTVEIPNCQIKKKNATNPFLLKHWNPEMLELEITSLRTSLKNSTWCLELHFSRKLIQSVRWQKKQLSEMGV